MAGRSCLSEEQMCSQRTGRSKDGWRKAISPRRPVQVQDLSWSVHGHGRYDIRKLQSAAAQMATGSTSDQLKRTIDVSIRQVETELDVTYKTAWHMVHRMLSAATAYNGPNTVFGEKIRKHISSIRPKPPKVKIGQSFARWYMWRKKHPLGERIVSTGLLLSFAAPNSPSEDIDRTERLLRVLIPAVTPMR
jgi:hypothetical protein